MGNEIQINSLLDNKEIKDKYIALFAKLDWFRLRCLLETKAVVQNGVDSADYSNADVLMNRFLSMYLNDLEEYTDDKIASYLNQKYDTKEFEKDFYEFLSTVEADEYAIGESWQDNAKFFIEKLKAYRKIGTIDGNLSEQLMDYAKKINNDPLRYIYELIQNADDCEYNTINNYDDNESRVEVKIEIKDDSLIISYPEDGMTYSDIIAITTIGQSNKRVKKRKRIIGEKGRGFKTIFSICDYAEIHSGKFDFKLSQNSFAPEWIDSEQENHGTKMILHFKDNSGEANDNKNKFSAGADLFGKIKERYGFNENKKENILKNCPIIFTNNIEKLVIKYKNETLMMAIKKDIKTDKDKKMGIATIRYEVNTEGNSEPLTLECYWYEKDVVFSYEEYRSHYKEIFENDEEFNETEKKVKTYPVVLLAPKWENGIKDWKGNLFTYLPTFTNINAPISIHAPFELNEDRSCMWINGLKGDEHSDTDDFDEYFKNKEDSYTTKWNRRLFLELFKDQGNNTSLVKYAFENLVDEMKQNNVALYDYLPAYKNNNHQFFLSQDAKYDECIKKINSLCEEDNKNIIFENFKTLKFLKCLYNDNLFCCNDNPRYFDDVIDNIFISETDDKATGWIGEFIEKLLNNENANNENSRQKTIQIIKTLKDCDNILALGAGKIELEDEEKLEFINILLEKRYNVTIKELYKEKHSDYLPLIDNRMGMKAIRFDGKYMNPADSELWILQEENQAGNDYLKIIRDSTGVKDDEDNYILISKIYGDSFKNKVESDDWGSIWKYMYKKEGNTESINCSFDLYKALMYYYSKTDDCDWYEYSNKCLNKNDEEYNSSENKKYTVPAENLKTIWRLKYQEYRGD